MHTAGNRMAAGGGLVLLALLAVLGPSRSLLGEDLPHTTAALSVGRSNMARVAVGDEAFFAGGSPSSSYTNVVDIYNGTTHTWSTSGLSQARYSLAAAALGGKVLFAGGYSGSGISAAVDIYDTASHAWSTASLSHNRYDLAAAAAGNKVFFAGGYNYGAFDTVDVYDTSSHTWTTTTLSGPRAWLAGASAQGVAVFAGGRSGYSDSTWAVSDLADIYDSATGTWSQAHLSQARQYLTATACGSKIFFAGGNVVPSVFHGYTPSDVVDIYDVNSHAWTVAHLSVPRDYLAAACLGDNVLFAGGFTAVNLPTDVVDIYNVTTGQWSSTTLSLARGNLAGLGTGTEAIFAGGYSGSGYSAAVDVYTPEPATLSLLALGGAVAILRRRRAAKR